MSEAGIHIHHYFTITHLRQFIFPHKQLNTRLSYLIGTFMSYLEGFPDVFSRFTLRDSCVLVWTKTNIQKFLGFDIFLHLEIITIELFGLLVSFGAIFITFIGMSGPLLISIHNL